MANAQRKSGSGAVPEFTIHDRCQKARDWAELEQEELADRIDVSRATVSNYETGATTHLKKLVLRQWALACGVDYDWLMTGDPGKDQSGGDKTPSSEWAPRDSNPEPTGSMPAAVLAA